MTANAVSIANKEAFFECLDLVANDDGRVADKEKDVVGQFRAAFESGQSTTGQSEPVAGPKTTLPTEFTDFENHSGPEFALAIKLKDDKSSDRRSRKLKDMDRRLRIVYARAALCISLLMLSPWLGRATATRGGIVTVDGGKEEIPRQWWYNSAWENASTTHPLPRFWDWARRRRYISARFTRFSV